jgi:hypothetical protein
MILTQLSTWLGAHPLAIAEVTLVVSAAVDALPAPSSSTSLYCWFYTFCHGVLQHTDKFSVKLAPKEDK